MTGFEEEGWVHNKCCAHFIFHFKKMCRAHFFFRFVVLFNAPYFNIFGTSANQPTSSFDQLARVCVLGVCVMRFGCTHL